MSARNLGRAAVVLMLVTAVAATALTPPAARRYLVIVAFATAAFVIQSAASEPRDLLVALLLCLAPVVALVGSPGATWLVGPLAALLLVGAEFSALSWASRNEEEPDPIRRRRSAEAVRLGGMGLAAALALHGAATLWSTGNALVFALAAGAMAALGGLFFRLRGA